MKQAEKEESVDISREYIEAIANAKGFSKHELVNLVSPSP